jgi:phage gp29-like protein
MGAPSKRAKRLRTADEFDVRRLALQLQAPKSTTGAYAWSLEDIRGARDAQMLGQFRRAVRLAESMRTDDALFVARGNRLAPQRSVEVQIVPSGGARGKQPASEADGLFGRNGIGLTSDTIADIHGSLVDHGVAFSCNRTQVRDDGSRTDVFVSAWPTEWVRWDAYERAFKTQTEGGFEETIVHGDGRWTVYCNHELEPFKHGVLLAAALVWARHAFGVRDWAKGSVAHGNAKVVGKMPEGVSLQKEDGTLSDEAAAFLELLKAVAGSDSPAGIAPFGSDLTYLVNGSSAWQIFQELVNNAEKAAARIYLGTDGTLGATGGAPGVDIQALLGVASTLVEGDLECLERGFRTGILEPWTAMNWGDSSLAPTRKYMLPDPDKAALKQALATRSAAFYADLKGTREAGIPLTQEHVDALAAAYGVIAPKLPEAPTAAPSPAPAPATPLRRAAR